MTPPDPSVILDVWERGLRQPLQRQVVALLAAVVPGSSEASIAAMPLGPRDALLLDLRERLFGPDLATVARCPNCAEQLQAGFTLADVRLSHAAVEAGGVEAGSVEAGSVEAGGVEIGSIGTGSVETASHRILFRPPATADLLAIPEDADAAAARAILLERCVTANDTAGNRVDPGALPPELMPLIAEGMAKADPQAVVELHVGCAACGHGFDALFDIAAFLMREIHIWAQQMLRDINCLARAYGWREADILALSPMRRQLYLDMVAR